MIIESQRLIIRELTPDDLDVIHQLLDHDIDMEVFSRDERAKWLQWTVLSYKHLEMLHQPPYGERALTLKDTGELVGAVGYVPTVMPQGMLPSGGAYQDTTAGRKVIPQMGLYYAVATRHQRKGYATEAAKAMIDFAFNDMGFKRIVATTAYDNIASQTVMRKLGMRLEHNRLYEEMPWFQVIGILENEPRR